MSVEAMFINLISVHILLSWFEDHAMVTAKNRIIPQTLPARCH